MVAVVLVLGQATLAQYQLDNNLQVGSGRINAPGAGNDFQDRNNLVSGLVVGGREFRGDEAAISAETGADFRQWRTGNLVSGRAFRDELGSDELFRFRARSLSINLESPRGSQIANQAVFSGEAPFSASDLRRANGLGGTSAPYVGLYQSRAAGAPQIPVRMSEPRSILVPAGEQIQKMGLLKLPEGQILELEASPLRGFRSLPWSEEIAKSRQWENEELPPLDSSSGGDFDLGMGDGQIDPDALDSGEVDSGQINPTGGFEGPFLGDLSAVIGQVMVDVVVAPADEDQLVNLDQRIEEIQASIFGPLEQGRVDTGPSVYRDLLAKIEAVHDRPSDDEQTVADQAAGAFVPGTDLLADIQLEEPSLKIMREAMEARERAIQRALGIPADLQSVDQAIEKGDLPARLGRLVEKLDYDLPRMSSMATDTQSRVNEFFRVAEEHLAAGKYFDAEQVYHKILRYKSGHVLARVGLIHAQLGAGLIKSSAMQLRRHFTDHPELIAARYESNLLPDSDRLRWVQKQLEKMISISNIGEPALMLAYLGYQIGSQNLVRYGLDTAQASEPNDALLPLLRRVWFGDDQVAGEAARDVADLVEGHGTDDITPSDASALSGEEIEPETAK